jgi:hypothetical protein
MSRRFLLKGNKLEKRIMTCPKCNKQVEYDHVHTCVYGMRDTHMAGSERIKCMECNYELTPKESKERGIKFILDEN